MANEEHLDVLKSGVETWNAWRKEHADIRPDLRGADLGRAALSTANLPLVNLSLAKLSGADLHEADLRSASIVGSYRDCADLSGADLRGANLRGATLRRVNLEGANLRGAKLGFTNLYWAKLDGAQFDSRTQFSYTVLGYLDLSTAIGLDTVLHISPSTIGIDTIYRSGGKIPEVFLRGCGVPENFIAYMRSLAGAGLPAPSPQTSSQRD